MGIARSLAAALGASVIIASASAAGQETETIETLVTGQYAHGLPAGEVRRFAGTENTAILVAILRDPAAGPHHPNAAEALGLVGGPETTEILMAVADSVTDLSDQPRIAGAARRSALRALGMLAARHPAEAAEIVRHLESAALPGGSDADPGTGDVETAATVGLTLAASPGADAALCRIAGTVGAHPRVRAAARAHIHGAKTERNACPPALRGTQRAARR